MWKSSPAPVRREKAEACTGHTETDSAGVSLGH